MHIQLHTPYNYNWHRDSFSVFVGHFTYIQKCLHPFNICQTSLFGYDGPKSTQNINAQHTVSLSKTILAQYSGNFYLIYQLINRMSFNNWLCTSLWIPRIHNSEINCICCTKYSHFLSAWILHSNRLISMVQLFAHLVFKVSWI